MKRRMDNGSLIIALITLVLFLAALFTKGLSHDLFLEAGVFLVSVKIFMGGYRNNQAIAHLDGKLDMILAKLGMTCEKNPHLYEQSGSSESERIS